MRSYNNDRPLQRAARRIAALLFVVAAALPGAARAAFGFDDVAAQAQALAKEPYKPPPPLDAQRAALDYDAYRKLRFRPASALWRGSSPFEMQFFPLGRAAVQPLRLFEVKGGQIKPIVIPASAFDYEGVLPPGAPDQPTPVAGWRLTYPLHEANKRDEVLAFLGASYFRGLGQQQRYGLSARGIAIDSVGGSGEEFPAFTAYWFETPAPGATQFAFHALLDGPRITGAYRFVVKPGRTTTVDVQARLFLRSAVGTLGVAPLTSMFLHGENQPVGNGDFRPEVHDSDGLSIQDGNGEWIWRPLTNPKLPFVTSFSLRSPKGFGLLQRDRNFGNYEDIEARYEMRPSAWVETLNDWGAGRVELLQFNTPDETHDNVVAYWVPAKVPAPGAPVDLAWRLHWQGPASGVREPIARVVQTRTGHGYVRQPLGRERQQFVIDFAGPGLPSGPDEAVKVVASGNPNVRVVRLNAYPNPVRGGWRATVEFDRIDPQQALELRVALRRGENVLTETWSYAASPQ